MLAGVLQVSLNSLASVPQKRSSRLAEARLAMTNTPTGITASVSLGINPATAQAWTASVAKVHAGAVSGEREIR